MKPKWNPPKFRGDQEVGAAALGNIRGQLSNGKRGLICGTFHHIGIDIDSMEWARVLRVRHESGEPLNTAQIDLYRSALRLEKESNQP